MKKRELGFSTIEVIVTIGISALIALGSTYVTDQTIRINGRTQDNMTAITQVENAGYWLTVDAQMAEDIVTEGLTSPDFLNMTWTEWVLNDDSIYHSVTYYFEDLDDGIGTLMRYHWSSSGANETTIVGQYLYYDTDDPGNTSQAEYDSPTFTIRLVSTFGETTEKREFQVTNRPDF
jgi:hypothetical protein